MAFKGAVRPDDAMDVKNERSDFVEDLSDLVHNQATSWGIAK
jgi:hypothetical protein